MRSVNTLKIPISLAGSSIAPDHMATVVRVPAQVAGNSVHELDHIFEVAIVVEGPEDDDERVVDGLCRVVGYDAEGERRLLQIPLHIALRLIVDKDESGQRVIGSCGSLGSAMLRLRTECERRLEAELFSHSDCCSK
jgi:hypothetical protein